MGKSAPRAPDPAAVARAQSDANRLNVYGPYGAQVFGTVDDQGQFAPTTGRDAVTVFETPFQQQQRQTQEALLQQLGGIAGQRAGAITGDPFQLPDAPAFQAGIDRSGLPQLQSSIDRSGLAGLGNYANQVQSSVGGDFSADRQRVEDSIFNRQRRLLDPEFTQSRERLAQDLANRGIPIGSEASNRALDRLDRSQQQALADLGDRAIAAGGAEQSRLFGQTLQSGQFANQAAQLANALQLQARRQGLSERAQDAQMANQVRGIQSAELLQDQQLNNAARAQAIQESLLQRNQGINELAQLLGAVPQQPLPQMQTGISPVDVTGPMYQQFNADQQRYLANLQGLQGLGTAALLYGMPAG